MTDIERLIADSYELSNNVIREVPQPVITVRTSAYQHGKYIKQCIEGVLMQKTTYPFEYIIGEDYSTDGTREIVMEYAAKYPGIIRVITADYNVGMNANGRRCRQKYRGKYIALCEGDDYWTDPHKLQEQVDFLENNPQYSGCFTNAWYINEIDNSKRVYVRNLSQGDVGIDLIVDKGGYIYPTASLVYNSTKLKPELLNRIKGIPGDSLLIMNLSMHGKIFFLDRITCVYRRWKGGVHSGISRDQQALTEVRIKAVSGYTGLLDYVDERFKKPLKIKISRISLAIIKHSNSPERVNYYKYLALRERLGLASWKIKSFFRQILKV